MCAVREFSTLLYFCAHRFSVFHSVLDVTALLHVVGNVFKIVLSRKTIDKKRLLRLGIPSVQFVLLGLSWAVMRTAISWKSCGVLFLLPFRYSAG